MNARTTISVGTKVLLADGVGLITDVTPANFAVRGANGSIRRVGWADFDRSRAVAGSTVVATHVDLYPWWDSLPESAQEQALTRLEVVHLIVTGYRDGHPELARDDEPRAPYGPMHGESLNTQAAAAAEEIRAWRTMDPVTARRVAWGDLASIPGSRSTVKRWVREWRESGIRALVDQRAITARPDHDRVHPTFRQYAERELATFTGDISKITVKELNRRTRVALRKDGLADLDTPQRATAAYLSEVLAQKGKTTRAHRSNHLRDVAGHKEFPAIRPGQIVAVDATRCDNLIVDEYDATPRSVEILTAIDVASRVVLACRLCPISANSADLRYLIYDILRAFHMTVDGTSITDWRWAGLPGVLDLSDAHVSFEGPGRARKVVKGRPLDGVHLIPSVWPDGFRVDRGSINISSQTQLILEELGIDLLPNRGGKSNDNAHIERWWETLQDALQQSPGYKGHNTTERGRLVMKEPLGTWRDTQTYLRWWIGTHYHRDWHTGIALPGMLGARLTPLEAFDALLGAAGRLDVPQRHDLLYQLLDIVWLTPNHTGVEYKNLSYSAPVLDDYRTTYTGQFRPQDRAIPLYVDPNDLGQLHFQDPETGIVHEIPWRGRDKTLAPMTEKICDIARRRIQARGGNLSLTQSTAGDQILEQFGELMALRGEPTVGRQLFGGEIRVTASAIEHAAVRAANPNEAAADERHATTATHLDDRDELAVDLDGDMTWPDYIGLDH